MQGPVEGIIGLMQVIKMNSLELIDKGKRSFIIGKSENFAALAMEMTILTWEEKFRFLFDGNLKILYTSHFYLMNIKTVFLKPLFIKHRRSEIQM